MKSIDLILLFVIVAVCLCMKNTEFINMQYFIKCSSGLDLQYGQISYFSVYLEFLIEIVRFHEVLFFFLPNSFFVAVGH